MKPLELTVEQIAVAFPGTKKANIERYWPFVRVALEENRLESAPIVAFALATIAAESAGFTPISEMVSRYNTRLTPFDAYEHRANLGNTQVGDGSRYRGRGFVQLTGRANYLRYGDRIGVDLIDAPERAIEPRIAAQLLAMFVADREDRILAALKIGDLAMARRAVNGGTHGLDRFARAFHALMEAMQ